MSFKTITDTKTFESIVANNQYVFVDFGAAWCGPCKAIKPFVHSLPNSYPNLTVCYVDVDVCEELSDKYNIKSVPTFFMFVDGKRVKALSGASQSAITKLIDTYCK